MMGLEKRVRRLEKQVVLLKAKVKANDLWKLELQTWIYQKFKRLIVDTVPCSASSSSSSSDNNSESEEKDPMFTMKSPRKKRKRIPRPEGLVVAPVVENHAEENNIATTSRTRSKQAMKRAAAKIVKTELLEESNDMDQETEQDMALHLLENVHQDLIVVHEERTTTENVEDGTNNVEDTENSGIDSSMLIAPFLSGISGVGISMSGDNDSEIVNDDGHDVKNTKSAKKKNGDIEYYSQTVAGSSWMEPDSEVRPDLQKYFRFVTSPINDGKLRLLCLMDGCGTVLKVRPRCKWFNPVRHLACVHKISEYVEQTPSSAMLGHVTKVSSKKYLDL